MIKIIIEGPQGCGKTLIASVLQGILRRNKKIRTLFAGPPPLVGIADNRNITKKDKEVYDIIIKHKLANWKEQ